MPQCVHPVTVFQVKPRSMYFGLVTVYDVYFMTPLPLQAGSRIYFTGPLEGGHGVQEARQNPQGNGNIYRIVKTTQPPFPLNVILNQPAGQVRLTTCFGPFEVMEEQPGFKNYYQY